MTTTQQLRTNRFPGACAACGNRVDAQAGLLIGSRTSGWGVKHRDGECPQIVETGLELESVEIESGRCYMTADDVIVRTKTSRSTGNVYGLEWTGSGWRYAPGIVRRLVRPITAEEAAKFGHAHDFCVFCTRALTDDGENRSVEVGYGPVCARRNGLPWGSHR